MKFLETLSMPSDLDGFILPNINILKESTNNIITMTGSFKTHFMLDIQLRCERLSSLIPELSSTIENYNVQIIAELNNQIIDSYLDTIQEILAELQNPNISQEYRQLLLKAEQEKTNLLSSEIINIRILCETKESILSRQLFYIKNTLIKERLVDVIAEIERQKEKIINAIGQKENKKQKLIEERETLIQSLEIMREINLFDIFKDKLPTDKYIDKLDLTQPKNLALKEGIHIYKKNLKN
ncbi:alpha-xenorhabdolysin family binary toxin subunit B [Nostoc sp. CENA67]|uniref:Alpha-xenorhabdolysin family binary toxin subunit B n=1 Tax=Amazonocrinis nigriterrae CENA67 TaxID=2794033 RepID=A0A8J7HYD5_9NOST|nr:alpha-xenorhabdolysin family binary toxin subunit B [Amazonocrinis nigriterrae CENA67]